MQEITQTIHEASSWNPFGFLADNALLALLLVGFGLFMLIKFIGSPKRLFK
jgi:hypothetical protein